MLLQTVFLCEHRVLEGQRGEFVCCAWAVPTFSNHASPLFCLSVARHTFRVRLVVVQGPSLHPART